MTVAADRVCEIFTAALRLPPEGRDAFLRAACAGADDVRQRVERLIQAHVELGSLVEPDAAPTGPSLGPPAEPERPGHVLSGLKKLDKTHKSSVERANFVVLRSPDVPSMLVETAFITNPEEERRLNDPRHRSDLARAILDGVNMYFTRQPPPGTLYAARAEASEVATAAGAGGR